MKVLCVETEKVYSTIEEAARDVYISRQYISLAIHGKRRSAAGYHWRFIPLVRCLETGKEYMSLTEAAQDTGAKRTCISLCCDGKRTTSGGYRWEWC